MRTARNLFIALLVGLVAGAHAQAPSSKKEQPRIVLGQLGQTLNATRIHQKMNSKSAVFYRAKPYEYIVIRRTKSEKWYGVLLQNGKQGYILSAAVARLPYEVSAPKATGRQGVRANNAALQSMLDYSFKFMGTPYVWGGNSLSKGVDCSGFVQQLFGKIGIDLPRTSYTQVNVGKPIERLEQLLPGDRLYFWDAKRGRIGHTGIFLGFFQDGGAYFIHSSSGKGGVSTDDLRGNYWRKNLVAARRDL